MPYKPKKHPLSPQSSPKRRSTRQKVTLDSGKSIPPQPAQFPNRAAVSAGSGEGQTAQASSSMTPRSSYLPQPECLTQPKRRLEPLTSQGSETFQQLLHLFHHSPDPFKKGPKHIPSDGTRAPAPFDTHLESNLQLKHVVFCPDLLRNLADATTSKLMKLEGDGFFEACPSPCSRLIPNQPSPISSTQLSQSAVIDEHSLTLKIQASVMECCAAGAAIIALKVVPTNDADEKVPFLVKSWSGVTQGAANPDISVRLWPSTCEMHPELAEKIQLLASQGLTDLALIEVKSLVAGTEATLDEILHSSWSGWVKCPGICDSKQYHNGPESVPIASLPLDADISAYLGHAPLLVDELDVWEKVSVNMTGHKQNAQWIRQQVFAQMVEKNATFAVFFLGNHIAVGVRHRQTQTLYVSPKISLINPGKGEISLFLLLMSVIVAGFEDALDRARAAASAADQAQAQSSESDEGGVSPTVTERPKGRPRKKHSKDAPERRKVTSATKNNTKHPRAVFLGKDRREQLKDITQISVKLGANIPVAESYATFVRESEDGVRCQPPKKDTSDSESSPDKPTKPVDCYFFRTNIRDGRAWHVQPFLNQTHKFSNKMVIKLATNPSDIAELRAEYKAYLKLSSKGYGNIVKVHGLFTYIAPEQAHVTCAIILMDGGGKPLSARAMVNENAESLKPFIEALKALHGLGFVHGRVDLDHYIQPVQGRVKKERPVHIVSLGESKHIGTHTTDSCPSSCTNATVEDEKCAQRRVTYNEIAAFATLTGLPMTPSEDL